MDVLKNREVFLRDPATTTIPNDGVAQVGEPDSPQAWEVLRYELESFVCEGEYAAGLERVLSAFLDGLRKPQQPAVWASGFYGSGKSHFVRVLEYLWRDVEFPDGVRARSLVHLPDDLKALLAELTRAGRLEGGLWSAAGRLAAGTGPVRLGLLAILFRAAGLPQEYPAARFVLWLQQHGWYAAVRSGVEARRRRWLSELRSLYVSPALSEVLLEAVPDFAHTPVEARAALRAQYPPVADISDDALFSTMDEVFALQSTMPGKRPLTLLVFDELQQFIAEDPNRTLQVQDVVEGCAARFGSRLLFVATGQSALQATPQLQKLQGRFSVHVSLSDTDVENVVRKVVLQKAPNRVKAVRDLLDGASGEIDRHLDGTKIGPRPEDARERVADYPLLPVRRRLWERVLRAVDEAGTAGQLRTQLRIVHDSARDVADAPLGTVIPADAIYWQLETPMQQSGVLLRDLATTIKELRGREADGPLRASLCALIFLIGKLPTKGPAATGLRPTADNLADLLVDDLRAGSAPLRERVPRVLAELVETGALLQVDDEYRLQTRESAEWDAEFRSRYTRILNDDVHLAGDRLAALKAAVAAALKGLSFSHGASKVKREFEYHFGQEAPGLTSDKVPLWVRDEWSVSERAVREEAQQAGAESPVVYVSLPRQEADALRQAIARHAAADETVKHKRAENPDAEQAQAAMASRAQAAAKAVQDFAEAIVKNGKVYQGGGNEVVGQTFADAVEQAVYDALARLFPRFGAVDQSGWDRVFRRASDGAVDALTALGYTAEVDKHPACQEVRAFVGGAGNKGSEVRRRFKAPPYGWPRDAVDGALLVLLSGGFLRASRNGQPVQARGLTQAQIPTTDFFSEGITVSTQQRLAVRGLATAMGLRVKPGEEADAAPGILDRLAKLAQAAGGDPPLPERPDTAGVEALQVLGGNELLVALADQRADLQARFQAWTAAAELIETREPAWERLEILLAHADGLPEAAEVEPQMVAIRVDRGLLDQPDPVTPLAARLAAALRAMLTAVHERLRTAVDVAVKELEATSEWSRLTPVQQESLLGVHGLKPVPLLDLGSDEALLTALADASLGEREGRVMAVPTRATNARQAAAKLLEPKTVTVRPRSATLRTPAEVEAYLNCLRDELLKHVIADVPVMIP